MSQLSRPRLRRNSRRPSSGNLRERRAAFEILEDRNMLASVIDVTLLGHTWSLDFRNRLTTDGWGDQGISLLQTYDQPLTWHNIDQVRIKFDAPVNVSASDLLIRGVNTPSGYNLLAAKFTYDPVTYTATWQSATAFPADTISIQIAKQVTQSGGAALTGRRAFSADIEPLAAIVGDVTDRSLFAQIVPAQFSRASELKYKAKFDVNGDGLVNLIDQSIVARTHARELFPSSPDRASNSLMLAASLRYDPVLIYEYVVNTFSFHTYAGVMKTTQSVIETKAGSAWELSRLLVDLYDLSGIAARYVAGRVSALSSDVANLIGITNPYAVEWALNLGTAGLNAVRDTSTFSLRVIFDHTWVEADVWTPTDGLKTVQLDPSWKLRNYQSGIDVPVVFDEAGYLSSTSNGSPSDYYAQQITAYYASTGSGVTVADVGYTGPIVTKHFTSIALPQPYTVQAGSQRFTQLPADKVWRLELSVWSGTRVIDYFISLADSNPDSIVLGRNPTSGRTELYLNGVAVASSATASALYADIYKPGATTATYGFSNGYYGGYLALGLNANQISAQSFVRLRSKVADVDRRYLAGETVSSYESSGPVLSLIAVRFFQMVNESREQFELLTHRLHTHDIEAIFSSSLSGYDVFSNQQIVLQPKGILNNVHVGRSTYAISGSVGTAAGSNVESYLISSHESLVLEDVLNTPGLSTVSSIQYANQHGIPVFTIDTPAKAAALFPQLTLTSYIKSEVMSDYNVTGRVVVPRDMTPINGFNGVGWIGQGMRIDWFSAGGSALEPAYGGKDTGPPDDNRPPAMPLCNDTLISDPVSVANGNVTQTSIDIQEPTGVLPLTFARYYNSLRNDDFGFGVGWSSTFNVRLMIGIAGAITLESMDGHQHEISPNGSGGYDVPGHLGGTFVTTATGYKYTDREGLGYEFDNSGRLVREADRFGNAHNLQYDSSGRLISVNTSSDALHAITFSYSGSLVSHITTWDGRIWRYDYTTISGKSYLAAVTYPDSVGREVRTVYTYYAAGPVSGLMKTVVDPLGNTTTFEYYANRKALAVTDPAGGKVSFAYNFLHHETRVVDERGLLTTYRFDDHGETVEIIYPDGTRTSASYQDMLLRTSVDARGVKTTYDYDARGNITRISDNLGIARSYDVDQTFDVVKQVTTTKSSGAVGSPIITTYNSSNVPVVIPEAKGTVSSSILVADVSNIVDIDVSVDIAHTYDSDLTLSLLAPDGRRVTLASGLGGSSANFHNTTFDDEAATPITSAFAPFTGTFRPQSFSIGGLSVLDGITAAGEWRLEITDVYDPDGGSLNSWSLRVTTQATVAHDEEILREISPVNGLVLSERREMGQMDSPANGETDDLVTAYTYTSQGLIDLAKDALGRITDYDYDDLGRMTKVTVAKGTADESMQQFFYDAASNLTAKLDGNNRRTEYVYDMMNRIVQVIEPDPDGVMGPQSSPTTVFVYDVGGNLVRTIDPNNVLTQFTYTPRNLPERTIDAFGHFVLNEYDAAANVVAAEDPLGNRTTMTYDQRNRIIKSQAADGGITNYQYDAAGNLVSLTDPLGNRTAFAYDVRNRLVRETDALNKTNTFVYDGADNLIQKTDRNGRTTIYAYDDVNRLTSESWTAGANAINYAYDKAGNLIAIYDSISALSFTYDALNRVKSVDNRGGLATQGTSGAPRVVLTYAYDAVGNVLSVNDTIDGTAGATASYQYDALDRLTQLTQAGTGLTNKRVDLAYDSLGRYSSLRRYSDLAGTQLVASSSYEYDGVNRLNVVQQTNASGQLLDFYNLDFDAAGRISRITDIDGVVGYQYDNRNELIGANYDASREAAGYIDEVYRYDANGNRVLSSIHGSTYATGPGNRLLSDGIYGYQYDGEGNLVKRTRISGAEADGSTVREFVWDHRNRLVAVTDKLPNGTSTQVVRFSYDGLNRRISKSVDTSPTDAIDAAVTRFIYDREDVILDFIDADGSGSATLHLSQRYMHGAEVDEIFAQDDSHGAALWYLTDHLGSVRDIVSNSGVIINHINYDSYGNVTSQSGLVNTHYGFTNREFDVETGLQFSRARTYDPVTGRFISPDPFAAISNKQVPYNYANNSPIAFVDPLGMDAEFAGPPQIRIVKVAGTLLDPQWNPGGKLGYGVAGLRLNVSVQISATVNCTCGTQRTVFKTLDVPVAFGFGYTLPGLNIYNTLLTLGKIGYYGGRAALNGIEFASDVASFVYQFPGLSSVILAAVQKAIDSNLLPSLVCGEIP